MVRGTAGAPRNNHTQDTQVNGLAGRGSTRTRPGGTGGTNRLIAFICGRRSKWVIVVFWLLIVAALGGLAGKLQGA